MVGRNRHWCLALAATTTVALILLLFGPVVAGSGGLVLRPLAGIPLLLIFFGCALWFAIAADVRVAQIVQDGSGWLRYPTYVLATFATVAFGLMVAAFSLVVSLDSFGAENLHEKYRAPSGESVVGVSHGFLDVWNTYHVAHGPFFREADEYSGGACTLTTVKPRNRYGEPPAECVPPGSASDEGGTSTGKAPETADPVQPVSPGYDVDPNARPTGELYFSAVMPEASGAPKVELWAYTSASASSLQRSVNGGDPETVEHPQGRDEAMRFISEITRLSDGTLRAVVGYPTWVDSRRTEIFYSDDDGATWRR